MEYTCESINRQIELLKSLIKEDKPKDLIKQEQLKLNSMLEKYLKEEK